MSKIYGFTVLDREGKEVSLDKFAGKVLLIVNTATGCGFTPQYAGLEKMYEDYKDKGFLILDFPCNQFANQAPGTNDEIHQFCTLNYNVQFPQFKKIEVNGPGQAPLFKMLKEEKSFKGFDLNHPIGKKLDEILSKEDPKYKRGSDIKWNFTKFLINREGRVLKRFEPTTDISEVRKEIEKAL